MIVFVAPEKVILHQGKIVIFLGGSIEMDKASRWQERIIKRLQNIDCVVLNPRRTKWDASWKQDKNNVHFAEQVNWELDGIEMSNLVLIYLEPGTKAPISLLEYGLAAKEVYQTVIVYCPEGYWRKGNVDIVAERNNINVFEDEEELILHIIEKIKQLQ